MPNNDRAQRRLNAKRAAKQNRHQLEALRREQAKRERRRFLIVTGIVVLVGLIIVGAAVIPSYLRTQNLPSHKSLASYGASASAATCDPAAKLDPEPGPKEAKTADDADRYHLAMTPAVWAKYKNNPPASGPHNPQPMPAGPHYYEPTAGSEPSFVEQLVHNLEHGYVVLWYDDTIAQDKGKLKALDDMGTNLQANGHEQFIAAPWPTKERGTMDGGKHVAITSWRNRQLCNDISGAVLGDFVKAHSPLCAPEPPADADTGQPATPAKVTAACGTQPTPAPTPGASATVSSSPTGSPTATPSTSATPTTSATTSKSASPSAS